MYTIIVHSLLPLQEDYVLLPKALESLSTGAWRGKLSLHFCHFATHPMSGEKVMVFMIHLPRHFFFLLFKSPSVQISYCSIITNVEQKEARILPYESKSVFFRWMIIEPLGVAGNGPLSPLVQRNTNTNYTKCKEGNRHTHFRIKDGINESHMRLSILQWCRMS